MPARGDRASAVTGSGPEPAARLVATAKCGITVLSMGPESDRGPPAVFLHGFGGDHLSWRPNQPALAQGCMTHAVDLPGHGGSVRAFAALGSGSVRALAASVVTLLDALDIARAHVVGHSMGGAISLLLAATTPDRVASVTAIAPGGLGPEFDRGFVDAFLAAEDAAAMRAALGRLFANPASADPTMVTAALAHRKQSGAIEALRAIAAANFTPTGQKAGLRPLLDGVKSPAQIIWGREDRILPVAQCEGLPSAIKVTVLDQAGHMPHVETAATVNALIAEHIQRA